MALQLVEHLLDQYPVQGIDLSYWNNRKETAFLLDPAVLLRGGYRFAAVRRSQGTWKDPLFDEYWKILKETVIPVNGVNLSMDRFGYHFLDYYNYNRAGGRDAEKAFGIDQARFFWDAIKKDPGELPPYLDLETNAYWFVINYQTAAPVMNIALNFLQELERIAYYMPGIYGSKGVFAYLTNAMKRYDFWVAWYNDRYVTKKILDGIVTEYGLKGWRFWQHASDGDWNGDNIADGLEMGTDSPYLDLNVFNGDLANYSKYAGKTPPPVIDPEDPTPEPPLPAVTKTIRVLKVTSSSGLNIRNKPATTGSWLGWIAPGSSFESLDPEPITRPGEVWHRVGQGQYMAEYYNGKRLAE